MACHSLGHTKSTEDTRCIASCSDLPGPSSHYASSMTTGIHADKHCNALSAMMLNVLVPLSRSGGASFARTVLCESGYPNLEREGGRGMGRGRGGGRGQGRRMRQDLQVRVGDQTATPTGLVVPASGGNTTPVARVDEEVCTPCGACRAVCPTEAITLGEMAARVKAELCCGCGACVDVCPNGAIRLS